VITTILVKKGSSFRLKKGEKGSCFLLNLIKLVTVTALAAAVARRKNGSSFRFVTPTESPAFGETRAGLFY